MTPQERKSILLDRVELAIADHYKTKQETQKRKTCSQCSRKFLGQDGADTCGSTCRKRKQRSK